WKNRWSDHAGAFPSDAILGARCMLDWLGPVAAATARSSGPVFDVVIHPAQEIATWQASHARRPTLTPRQEQLARLEPIVPAPPKSAEADQIIRRLEFVYPFEPFTRLAAVDAVTRLAKSGSNVPRTGVTRELPNPGFVTGQSVSPADIGIATHQVLRHLDFGRPCDADDLKAQIRNLVERRIISAAQADLADRDALAWFIQSELGALLRSHANSLRRELPMHLAVRSPDNPESADPRDQIMLRGRIDVLVPRQAGIVLIDYKTDSILAAEVPNRAQSYLPQLAQYTHAIETMIGKPISAAHLVFLFPRVIWITTDSD
ncbi:MAG TPA: PD-(D/E)XK nuclease family protein, partial [Tepidisphaeraceae bacterium]|nr:PD-(D/E)XK nuclease family protein [Tepidisphaeraceae bacterium]